MKKICINFCMAILFTQMAMSSTFIKVNLNDIVERSNTIFRGKIVTVTSEYEEDSGKIYTKYLIYIDKNILWKGNHSTHFELRLIGGVYGDKGLDVEGMPRFEVNDEIFFFITDPAHIFPFPGGPQGIFRIKTVANRKFIMDAFHRPIYFQSSTGEIQHYDENLEKNIERNISENISYLVGLETFEQMIQQRLAAKQKRQFGNS